MTFIVSFLQRSKLWQRKLNELAGAHTVSGGGNKLVCVSRYNVHHLAFE